MALPGYEHEIFPMRMERKAGKFMKIQRIQFGRLEGIARLHRITETYESAGKPGKKVWGE